MDCRVLQGEFEEQGGWEIVGESRRKREKKSRRGEVGKFMRDWL